VRILLLWTMYFFPSQMLNDDRPNEVAFEEHGEGGYAQTILSISTIV
jgi:hypothetical protein